MEKHQAIQSQLYSVIMNQDEITDQDEINKYIFYFYQSLFSRKVQNKTDKIEAYLEYIPLPKLTNEPTLSCDGIISEDKVLMSLKSMGNNKSSVNYGPSKNFYECFWNEIKNSFLASIHRAFLNQELSSPFHKQAIIKMLGKKDKGERLIKNWRPISLINAGMKSISKVLSTRIKNVWPFLISQIKGHMLKISESRRVVSDILEISNWLSLEGFPVTAVVEKVFDSVNHCFLLHILRKFGFGMDFLTWLKAILNNQECCIIMVEKQQNISN